MGHVTAAERQRMKDLYEEYGSMTRVGEMCGRDKNTVQRAVAGVVSRKGRPALAVATYNSFKAHFKKYRAERTKAKKTAYLSHAYAKWRLRHKATLRTIRDRMATDGCRKYKVQSKTQLSGADVRERKAFCLKHRKKTVIDPCVVCPENMAGSGRDAPL
jgi:IS30 family transposase